MAHNQMQNSFALFVLGLDLKSIVGPSPSIFRLFLLRNDGVRIYLNKVNLYFGVFDKAKKANLISGSQSLFEEEVAMFLLAQLNGAHTNFDVQFPNHLPKYFLRINPRAIRFDQWYL